MTHATLVSSSSRRGFALPVVVIVVFVLAAALAGGFAMARLERGGDDSGRATIFAQSNAEAALQRAMTERAAVGLAAGLPPASDSVRVTLPTGYADVIVTRVRPAVGAAPPVYVVRAHGFSTASRVAQTPAAEYTVTQMAVWRTGTMTVKSAFTSLTGIAKNGTSGEINGNDDCPLAAGGGKPPVAGVAVPQSPGYTQSGGSPSSVLQGSPLIDSTLGTTAAAMAPNVPVDWVGITSGSITPDFTSTWDGVGFPSAAWFSANPGTYPITIVANDTAASKSFTLPYAGRGMLIVFGNMIISGSDMWNGVVLVGGTITSNGNNTINGAVVTGLNVKLGYPVPVNAIGNGNKDFQYNSCTVASAVSGLGRMMAYKNTWHNTHAVY